MPILGENRTMKFDTHLRIWEKYGHVRNIVSFSIANKKKLFNIFSLWYCSWKHDIWIKVVLCNKTFMTKKKEKK